MACLQVFVQDTAAKKMFMRRSGGMILVTPKQCLRQNLHCVFENSPWLRSARGGHWDPEGRLT